MELLENRELYTKLDEFYTAELRKYVFYNDIQGEKDTHLSKHENIMVDLVKEYDIDIMNFRHLFEEIGYKTHFDRSAKKVQYLSQGIYYEELYKKFNI